ncbi:Glycylpeptide N-tetradecanoyltransferase 2 [Liparis tanakae]|uniref:Glycylpeptide N-tetradecanoyltransferase n=1 Tax=Liparis tanakae TaxID=230148 RepID=A0A4Z2ICT4_9TELE|nr:Glycylpeptide N-tetradecanoyltransferase 2 [Liparis tanakae]
MAEDSESAASQQSLELDDQDTCGIDGDNEEENEHMQGSPGGDLGAKRKKKKQKRKKEKPSSGGAKSDSASDSQEIKNPGLPIQKLQDIQRAMELLSCQGPAKSIDEAAKHKYQFWDTQPVPKLNEVVTSHGPIEADKDTIRQEPYSLPQGFMALRPPGWLPQWHCGVRVSSNKKLVGFISAIPADIRIYDTYWHRSLNPRKLVEVKFSHLSRNMTLQRTMKLYRLPDSTKTPGLRPMERRDIRQVTELLQKFLQRFQLAPSMGEEEVAHWFFPQDNIIDAFVVEGAGGVLTDFTSFYTLPSTVMHHPLHRSLKAAYSFYNVHTQTPLLDLMNDALILAKLKGFDVFNALDLMENKVFLEKLKFGIGDGNLQYYLYNWKCPAMDPDKVGLVLQ